MTDCPEPMIELLYGEPDPKTREALMRHRDGCPICQQEYAILATVRTSGIGSEAEPVPFERLWEKVAPELDRIDRRRRLRPPMIWLSAAALLVLSLLFFWQPPEQSQQAELTPELASFLERTQPFLLALSNVTPDLDDRVLAELVAQDRQRAADLAEEAHRMRDQSQTLQTRNLIEDIELLMLQVSNLRESEYRQGLEVVRAFMDRRTLLFELSLLIEHA